MLTFYLITFFIFGSNFAIAKVKFFKLPEKTLITDFPFSVKEGFAELDSKKKIWGLILSPTDPIIAESWSIKGGEILKNNNSKVFIVGNHQATIQNKNGAPLFEIEWQPENLGLQLNNCDTNYLELKIEKENLNFPLGISCDLIENPPRFTVSTLQDIEWDEFTFEELEGKGERWRTFNLPSGNLKVKEVGYFIFKDKKQKIKLPLLLSTLKFDEEVQKTKQIGIEKKIGFLVNSTKLQMSGKSYKSTNFSVLLEAQTERIFDGIKIGFLSSFPLGFSQATDQILSQRGSLNIGYYSKDLDKESNPWQWGILSSYQALNYSHNPTSFTLQSSTLGLGFQNSFLFNNNRLNFEFSLNNLGSKVFTNYSEFRLNYERSAKAFGFDFRWGAGIITTDIKAKTSTHEIRKISTQNGIIFLSI